MCLLEHATDALSELLAISQLRASPGDPWVPRVPGNRQRFADVRQPGEPSGALDLDPVIEDIDADVVTDDAVGAVDHGVDHPFEQGVHGDDRRLLETTVRCEGAA